MYTTNQLVVSILKVYLSFLLVSVLPVRSTNEMPGHTIAREHDRT